MPLISSDITKTCNRKQLCFIIISMVVIVTEFEYHLLIDQFAQLHWIKDIYHSIEFQEPPKIIIQKYTGEKSNIQPKREFSYESLIGKPFI